MAAAASVIIADRLAAVDVEAARLTAGLPAGRAAAVPVRAGAAIPTPGAVGLAGTVAVEVLPGTALLRQQSAIEEELPERVAAVAGGAVAAGHRLIAREGETDRVGVEDTTGDPFKRQPRHVRRPDSFLRR